MISINLVIGPIHGKCLLTRIPQNKHIKLFFQKIVQKKIIHRYVLMIYKSPRLPFKSILQCILMKLNYNTRIKEKLSKVYKGIGFLINLSNKLPRQLFLQFTRRLQGITLTMVIMCMISIY